MPFATLFSNVSAMLFGPSALGAADDPDRPIIEALIEAVVDAVDPRLRMVSKYREQLAPIVRLADLIDQPAAASFLRGVVASGRFATAGIPCPNGRATAQGRCSAPRPSGLRPGRASALLPGLAISTYGLRRAPRIHPVLAATHHAPIVEIDS